MFDKHWGMMCGEFRMTVAIPCADMDRSLSSPIYQDTSLPHAERTAALQRGRGTLEATLRAKGMFRLEVCPVASCCQKKHP